jgi:hypothetical protein
MHQFLAESRQEEGDALLAYLEELSKLDMVITYNGRHFDIPFIEKRAKTVQGFLSSALGGKPIPYKMPYNLDLYLVVSGHSPIRKFTPNLKQKTLENYLGLWQGRDDEISGADSVTLYKQYESTKDPALEKKILLHNRDDVVQLSRLLKVVPKTDFHKAMYSLGFPAGPLTVTKIVIQKDVLNITGIQRTINIDYMGFSIGDLPTESTFNSRDSSFSLKVPLVFNTGLSIADLEMAGIDGAPFEKYPNYKDNFLVLSTPSGINYAETNHFVKAYLEAVMPEIL